MKLDFIPFKSVGPFQINDDAIKYLDILKDYTFIESQDMRDADQYVAKDGSHIVLVRESKIDGEKKISGLVCKNNVYYNGKNLIGMTLDEFQQILKIRYEDKEPNGENGMMYMFFEELYISVDATISDNKIFTVFISS